nr:hypothetical protein [Deltaproteobacteria bacterium]
MDLSRGLGVLLVVAVASCARRPPASRSVEPAGEIVLFRDGALVVQVIPFAVPAGATATVVRAQLPAGVAPKDLA